MCDKLQPLFSFDFLILHNDIVFIKWIKYKKKHDSLIAGSNTLRSCLIWIVGCLVVNRLRFHSCQRGLVNAIGGYGLWSGRDLYQFILSIKRSVGFVVLSEEPPYWYSWPTLAPTLRVTSHGSIRRSTYD